MPINEAEIAAVELKPPGTAPDYNSGNPVQKVLRAIEDTSLAAEREHYLADSLEYLLPVSSMALYGPSGADWQQADPRQQENKNDFQKQNLRDVQFAGLRLTRGFATTGGWTGSFLAIAYVPLPGSPLAGPTGIYTGDAVLLYLEVGASGTGSHYIRMPYNTDSGAYEVELWAAGAGIGGLGPKAVTAQGAGRLLFRPDLVRGDLDELEGVAMDTARRAARTANAGLAVLDHAPEHSMHPIRPLRLVMAFGSDNATVWDSKGGRNHRYEFAMSRRGWRHFLGVGESANPHGGIGSLEFRNLYSNYFSYEERRRQIFGQAVLPELGRDLETWNVDADGTKPTGKRREAFLAVDYMDLHLLRPNAIIGLHRHRDNQEVFMVLEGKALMVVGDWTEQEHRDRAFEVCTLRPGELALVKGGGLHALANSLDENVLLFMFGGYD
jgi:mannose-6-phosphate isomerase-like protein (cupin superfamily)